MSDELECFRKAAELGCEDFQVFKGKVFFRCLSQHPIPECEEFCPEESRKRINRYAAAVCAEWWRDYRISKQIRLNMEGIDFGSKLMEDAARAFGKKYGETQ